jgi:hypothetical protein
MQQMAASSGIISKISNAITCGQQAAWRASGDNAGDKGRIWGIRDGGNTEKNSEERWEKPIQSIREQYASEQGSKG